MQRRGVSKYNSLQLKSNVIKSIKGTFAFGVGDPRMESSEPYHSAVLDYDKMNRLPTPGLVSRWTVFIIHALRGDPVWNGLTSFSPAFTHIGFNGFIWKTAFSSLCYTLF